VRTASGRGNNRQQALPVTQGCHRSLIGQVATGTALVGQNPAIPICLGPFSASAHAAHHSARAAGIGKVQQRLAAALLVTPAPAPQPARPGASSKTPLKLHRSFKGTASVATGGRDGPPGQRQKAGIGSFTIRKARSRRQLGSRAQIHLALTVEHRSLPSQHHPHCRFEPKSQHQGRSWRKTTCSRLLGTSADAIKGHPHDQHTPRPRTPDQPRAVAVRGVVVERCLRGWFGGQAEVEVWLAPGHAQERRCSALRSEKYAGPLVVKIGGRFRRLCSLIRTASPGSGLQAADRAAGVVSVSAGGGHWQSSTAVSAATTDPSPAARRWSTRDGRTAMGGGAPQQGRARDGAPRPPAARPRKRAAVQNGNPSPSLCLHVEERGVNDPVAGEGEGLCRLTAQR